MAQINLLPWREERREKRKREFFNVLVGVVIIAGGMLFLYDRYVRSEVGYQQSRNDYIRAEIVTLNARVEEINTLKDLKEEIKERMGVIQDLQGTRPIMVRMFDELVKTLPDGVYYDNLTREGEKLEIIGVAESNNKVSELMRRLENSEWFDNANLISISAANNPDPEQVSTNAFSLTIDLQTPDRELED